MGDTERQEYLKFHSRLRKEKGRAADHPCVDCGKPAKDWSWDKGRENFGSSAFGDNLDEYSPRCRSCHRKLDATGWIPSLETREKISIAKMGRALTPNHREAIRKGKTGKKRKPFSEEWKKNLSEAQKRRRATEREEQDHH